MKIKKGEFYKCTRWQGDIFKVNSIYKSPQDGLITSEYGEVLKWSVIRHGGFQKLYTIQDLKDGKVAVDNRRSSPKNFSKLAGFLGHSLNGYYDYYYFKSGDVYFYPTDSMPQLPLQKTEDFLVQLPKKEPAIEGSKLNLVVNSYPTKDNTPINPKHYSFSIKGTPCDLFDIGNAMDLNKEQFTALRYFRKKENQIEDTKKAIKCLERLVERLESDRND